MIRIDDEKENRGVRRQFFPFGNIIVGRDARRPPEPSVHLFLSERGPGAGAVRAHLPAKSMNSVFEREPWTGKSGKRDLGAGPVRARLPAKSMNSVFGREPWTGKSEKRGPSAGAVRARIPAKPMNSVFEREPWTGKSGKRGPGAGAVRARLPAKPMNSVFEREPGDTQNSKTHPTRRRSPTGPAAPTKFGSASSGPPAGPSTSAEPREAAALR